MPLLFSQRRQLAREVDLHLDLMDAELASMKCNAGDKVTVSRNSLGVVTALCAMGWLRVKPASRKARSVKQNRPSL